MCFGLPPVGFVFCPVTLRDGIFCLGLRLYEHGYVARHPEVRGHGRREPSEVDGHRVRFAGVFLFGLAARIAAAVQNGGSRGRHQPSY